MKQASSAASALARATSSCSERHISPSIICSSLSRSRRFAATSSSYAAHAACRASTRRSSSPASTACGSAAALAGGADRAAA
eukprot:5358539-Prymnesium_polylepis.1